MQAVIVQIIIAIVMMIVSYALTPKPKSRAPEAGELDVPKMKAGSPIPVIFGTVRIKSPTVVWYGDGGLTKIRSDSGK